MKMILINTRIFLIKNILFLMIAKEFYGFYDILSSK